MQTKKGKGIRAEEFEAMIEREGVASFIWTRSARDIPETEIVLYELANNRYGVIFRIFPPYYASDFTQKKLENFFKIQLPEDSSIQLFSFASKNIELFKKNYMATHSTPSNIGREDMLFELARNRVDFMDKYKHESIFKDRGQDVRLRSFVNLVCVTIPKLDEHNEEYQSSDVINIFSRVQTSLQEFNPIKFKQVDYVKLMRELLIPDKEPLEIDTDTMTPLNHQVVNNDSCIVIEDKTNTLGIGTSISEEEYMELNNELKLNTGYDDDDEEEELGWWGRLFSKKKEEEVQEKFTKVHAKVLTTKMYPSNIDLWTMLSMFSNFHGTSVETELPSQFFSSLTIYIKNKEKQKNSVLTKTQWNLSQTSQNGSGVTRYFPHIQKRSEESEAINVLLSNGDVPMSAIWSLIIMDDSLKQVSKYSEKIKKNFMSHNWILQEETIIHSWVFLYSLPLQFHPFILEKMSRMNTLFTSNCAAISPIMTGEHGFGSPILMYVDRSGQLSGFDIFASETNFNFLVIGTSGSGKSYMMADFFTNYLMTGAKIRVIDVGNSYRELCQVLKGQYIEFKDSEANCLNFFTNVSIDEHGDIDKEEVETITPLIGLMAMISLSPDDNVNGNMDIAVISSYISEAVKSAFKDRKRNAGMEDVLNALELKKNRIKEEDGDKDKLLQDLIIALYKFGNPEGEYYSYFNGDNNLSFDSDFVVLELEAIDANPHLKSVILASIATRINSEFFLGDRKQKKILAVDEAWSMMDNPNVSRFLETMARRIRKHTGALGIITQSLQDFQKNSATKAIFDSTANQIYLKQKPDTLAAAEKDGALGLDKDTVALMKTVQSKPPMFSELLVKNEKDFFIGRLITDRVAHWVYTNHHADMAKITEIKREFNTTDIDSRLILGYSEKNKTTPEEEYSLRLESGQISLDVE